MKAIGFSLEDEDASGVDHEDFMRGVFAKFGPRCFFCNLEGQFKSDCPQFWDATERRCLHQDNTESRVCTVSGKCTAPGWTEICICDGGFALGREYDVIISAPNRRIEMENLRPLRAELPAVWSDISKAMRGFRDHLLHMLVLDEVLGLELSNLSRQLKLKPGIDDDHRVIVAMSNDLWFRGMEIKEEGERRKNSKETRAHLETMVIRTKPEAIKWLHLTPRITALGADAFERGPVMIRKIHAYLVKEVNLDKNAEEKSAEIVNRVCQVTLVAFWTQNVKGEEGFDRTDSMLQGLGAG